MKVSSATFWNGQLPKRALLSVDVVVWMKSRNSACRYTGSMAGWKAKGLTSKMTVKNTGLGEWPRAGSLV